MHPQLPQGWRGQPQEVVAEATPQFIATEKRDFEIVMELRGGGTVGRRL